MRRNTNNEAPDIGAGGLPAQRGRRANEPDPQRERVYAWEEMLFEELMSWCHARDLDDGCDLNEEQARTMLDSLRESYLPHWEALPLRLLPSDDGMNCPPGVDPAAAFGRDPDEPRRRAVMVRPWPNGRYILGETTLLHEFAHAIVFDLNQLGVMQSHGPEFVGVLCFLYAQHFDFPARWSEEHARDFGVQVMPVADIANRLDGWRADHMAELAQREADAESRRHNEVKP